MEFKSERTLCPHFTVHSFPVVSSRLVAETTKNKKYDRVPPRNVRNETSQMGIQRLVTGNRCEAQGCYKMALWLVSIKSETSHWCVKHTNDYMRKAAKRTGGTPGIQR